MTPPPRQASPAPPDPPGLPAVRLDVRIGSGRPTTHPMTTAEFLFGGAEGCAVRLPGSHLPPIVCRLTNTSEGLTLRRVDPAFPVLVNNTLVTNAEPIRLTNGDRLAVGPADVTVSVATGPLRPRFVPLAAPTPAVPDPLDEERAALAKLRTQLEDQARELEADRVLWYRRRSEIEAECRRMLEQAPDLGTQEAELAELRRTLHAQYAERRDQLTQMQDVVRGATESLHQRRQEFEDEAARRTQELDARERQLDAEGRTSVAAREAALAQREEQLHAERDRHAADLVRLDRWQSSLDERQRHLDRRAAEVDERFEQLKRDTIELEDQVRLAEAEQDRITAESTRLEKQRTDLETQATRLAERSAQLEAQQAMLAVLRARLDRQQEDARQTAIQVAADRARLDTAQRDLDDRLREAERLRAELADARADQEQQQQLTAERSALLEATLAEIQQQKDALAAEDSRLRIRESDLDLRSADIAEQTAVMKARLTQVMELQERLEADRSIVRERELTLTDADLARQTFQEQLRRRSEELSGRSKQFDETTRRLHDERAALERERAELLATHDQSERNFAQLRDDLAAQAVELERRTTELTDREAALERQIMRLREAGRAVATARKDLAAARTAAEADRREVDALRTRTMAELDGLRREAPELEDRARTAVDRMTASRDVLRGHLTELHTFATATREELDALRAELRTEADRLRDREQHLDRARAEHRLAVSEFRQQLLDWQSRVAELKQTLAQNESRIESRQAEVTEAAKQADAAALDLARQAEELRYERQQVAERRTEVERHLSDMREWYRKKLRELAVRRDAQPVLQLSDAEDLEPGDRQLGELLRSLDLIDADTLASLWAEAGRQRRTLRHVLLASGAVTLYQLALIEAGNLGGLMLGRLRVVDRVRVTAREAVYRVFDPTRTDDPRGVFVLRHLAENEMDDAVRPDEFRQRFAVAQSAAHPNLVNTIEVLDVQGRPAALQEWVTGTPSADWPADVATPGVWVRLAAAAAAGLDAAHRAGLVHGAITSDSFLLTADGEVKLTGIGDPPWLSGATVDTTLEADLRAFGQVIFGWAQLAHGKKRGRAKGFPESLTAVVRRLEADPETPMADTATGAAPYRSASELVAELRRLAGLFPCPADAWEALIQHITGSGADETRKSA